MAQIVIRLDTTLVSRVLEDWEKHEFLGSSIEEIGIVINPTSRKTGEDMYFEIPFMFNSLKKGSVFEGGLTADESRYSLTIKGEMKVKLRPGVVAALEEADGGAALTLWGIARKPKDSGRTLVEIEGHEQDDRLSWLEVGDYDLLK